VSFPKRLSDLCLDLSLNLLGHDLIRHRLLIHRARVEPASANSGLFDDRTVHGLNHRVQGNVAHLAAPGVGGADDG